ncbi:MAG: GatB/YqeY domain-containing protein [Candidatus Paceibacterota bacterium]|jgi:hypothetical protein
MLHQTIKNQIIEAMRARDQVRLDTLRGLNALFQNEMIASKIDTPFLSDEQALPLVKRSVKQHRDSIEQFTKGGRTDLVKKEQLELEILESFMPESLGRDAIKEFILTRLPALKAEGKYDESNPNKASQIGKLTGLITKELAGKADGGDVKAVLEEVLRG